MDRVGSIFKSRSRVSIQLALTLTRAMNEYGTYRVVLIDNSRTFNQLRGETVGLIENLLDVPEKHADYRTDWQGIDSGYK